MTYDRAIRMLERESPMLATAIKEEVERLKGIANRNAEKGRKAAAAAQKHKRDAAIYKRRAEARPKKVAASDPFQDFLNGAMRDLSG